jgi:hypothetical protein
MTIGGNREFTRRSFQQGSNETGVRGSAGSAEPGQVLFFIDGTLRCLVIWAGTGVAGTVEISTPSRRGTAGIAAVVRASTISLIFLTTN